MQVLDEGSSDWKGRREQIQALRDQVKALKAAQVRPGQGSTGFGDVVRVQCIMQVTKLKSWCSSVLTMLMSAYFRLSKYSVVPVIPELVTTLLNLVLPFCVVEAQAAEAAMSEGTQATSSEKPWHGESKTISTK